MTVLIAVSGGAESPAIIFFLIHITIASLLLPHHHGFLYVTLAPALVGLVALLEYAGVLPHVAIVQPVRYRDPLYVSAVLLFFAAACYVMAYSCMTIAQRLRRRENELGGLYDGVRDVTSTLEITTVLDRIVEAAARVLACKAAAIRLIDQNRSQVEFAASWGLSDTYRDEVPGEYAKSVLDQDTLRDGVVHVSDVERDPRIWHPELVRDERIASMLSVAINGQDGADGRPARLRVARARVRRRGCRVPAGRRGARGGRHREREGVPPAGRPRPRQVEVPAHHHARAAIAGARHREPADDARRRFRRHADAGADRGAPARAAAPRVPARAHRRPARPGRRQGGHGARAAAAGRPARRRVGGRRAAQAGGRGQGARARPSNGPASPSRCSATPRTSIASSSTW